MPLEPEDNSYPLLPLADLMASADGEPEPVSLKVDVLKVLNLICASNNSATGSRPGYVNLVLLFLSGDHQKLILSGVMTAEEYSQLNTRFTECAERWARLANTQTARPAATLFETIINMGVF